MRTPHYQLVSAVGSRETLEIARSLDRLRALLAYGGLGRPREPRMPLRVYAFDDANALYARFQPAPDVESVLLQRLHGSFLAFRSRGDADSQRRLLGDYLRFVLRNADGPPYPAWYVEGLAEYLGAAVVLDDLLVLGDARPEAALWLLYGNALSLRRLLTADDVDTWSPRARRRFRLQAWATLHFFELAQLADFPDRRAELRRFIALRQQGMDPDGAVQRAFAASFEELELELLRYLDQEVLPRVGVPLAELEPDATPRPESLPPHGKRRQLGALALALGEPWHDTARHWLRRATASQPDDAQAQAELGLALVDRDPTAADARFERARALAGEDPEVLRLYGEALLRRTAEPADGRRLAIRARDAFGRSLAARPDSAATLTGLARALLRTPDPDSLERARRALERADQQHPGTREIPLTRARLELADGEPERAATWLERLPPGFPDDPRSDAEAERLAALREAAGLPPRPPLGTRHLEPRLVLERPVDELAVRGLSGWLEVAGRAGLTESPFHDLVIALDESASTLEPTGSDLDGDGIVGAPARIAGILPGAGSSDPQDNVLHAELEAARRLVERLDPVTTRVGIVSFGDVALPRTALGPPEAALDALERHERVPLSRGADLASALEGALEEFRQGQEPSRRRQRTIVLLSDGRPSIPSRREARARALALADQLGELGVPVHAFAIAGAARRDPELFRLLAERSGGVFVALEDPAQVVGLLAQVRFAGLAGVEIRAEPGGMGRAVRVFPDGSFDAFVPLVPGENRVSVTASLEDGRRVSTHRRVSFRRPSPPSARDEQEDVLLRRRLRTRTREIELGAEALRRSRGPADARPENPRSEGEAW